MTVRPVSKELQDKAIKELNEVVERVPEDIKHIQNWLSQTKYINARTDDQWILSFLRGCKFSLERTKEKLETYYTMKTIVPEFFDKRDPMLPEIQEVLNLGIFLPLPKSKDPDSPRITLLRNNYDPSKVNFENVIRTNMMIQDLLIKEDDQFIIAGSLMIQDMNLTTMAHMAVMTTGFMKKAMTLFQDGTPIRPKGMHFINIPSFFETMYNIVKPFLNEKNRSRMVVHRTDNLEELYKVVPKELLPKEYGGDGPTIAELTAYWKKRVENNRDWYLEDAKYKTDESKRPGKPKTSEDVFGVEGSFRKLNVD